MKKKKTILEDPLITLYNDLANYACKNTYSFVVIQFQKKRTVEVYSIYSKHIVYIRYMLYDIFFPNILLLAPYLRDTPLKQKRK